MNSQDRTLIAFWTPKETAAVLGVSENTLRRWRVERRGPRFLKFGDSKQAMVRYYARDVILWAENQRAGTVAC